MSEVIFLLKYWKYLVALLVLGAMFYMGARWQGGRDAVKEAVIAAAQAQRDAIAAATYAKAVQDRDSAEKAARDANGRIENDLRPKLTAATADGARLARLLHDALARPSSIAPSTTPDQSGSPDASGVPSSVQTDGGPIERSVADVLSACGRDSARLTALQAEVRGQL